MAVGSSDPSSLAKLGKTAKATVKGAADPDDSKEVETKDILPTGAYIAHPAVARPENVVADYYRKGAPVSETNAEERQTSRLLSPFGIQAEATGDITASIRIRGRDRKNQGQEVDYVPAYTKFILQDVKESYAERSQIIETFGDFYVFLFGQRPSMFQFSGTLINAVNHNWVQDFQFFYENFFRGSKTVELQARAIMTYGGRQVEGFILNTANQTIAATEEGVPFNFQMVVTQRNFLGFSEDFGVVRGPGGSLIRDSSLQNVLNQQAGAAGTGTSDGDTSDDQNAANDAMKGKKPPMQVFGFEVPNPFGA